MKTHLTQDDCPRTMDLLEDRRRCRSRQRDRQHFVCGQWTSAQREPGMMVVAAAAVMAVPSVR